jgi:hypothetical protein
MPLYEFRQNLKVVVCGRANFTPVGLVRVIRYKRDAELALRGLDRGVGNTVWDDEALASVLKVPYGLLHACKVGYERVLAKIMIIKELSLVQSRFFL